MKTYDLNLSTDPVRLTIDYKFFLVLADGGVPFDVSIFKGSGFLKSEGVQAGFGLKLNELRGREFIFTSATPTTIKVFIGDDEAVYQRLAGSVSVTNFPVSGGFTQVSSSLSNVALIISSAKNRRFFFVQNNDPASVMRVCVNGNSASVNSGMRLQPGESWGLEGGICPSAHITAIMESATTKVNNVEVVEF